MNIGEAARASGVSAKMIRYYEQIALITAAGRSDAGYRRYGEADLHTLRFIRRARDFGFAIEDIVRLLALWRDRERSSADVKELATQHVLELRRKIDDLNGMVHALEHLAQHCHGDSRPECPILDDLSANSAPTPPRRRAGRTGFARPARTTTVPE